VVARFAFVDQLAHRELKSLNLRYDVFIFSINVGK